MVDGSGQSMFGSVHDNLRYRLTLPGLADDALRVVSFTATAGLSSLFSYEVVVVTDAFDVDTIIAALGDDAAFAIEREGNADHEVHGVVARVEPDGAKVGDNQARTTVLLRPRAAILQLGREFRIFQQMNTVDIVSSLLDAEQVTYEWRLRQTPPAREYCTQFGESDYDFLRRLVAEEGAHFTFETKDGATTMVFVSDADGYPPINGDADLSFRDVAGATTGEHVRTIVRRQVIAAGAFEHRDYDLTRPTVPIVADFEAARPLAGTLSRRLLREYPGRFVDASLGQDIAQKRMEEALADTLHFRGTAATARLAPGRTFSISEHAEQAFNTKLLVTSISLHGAVQGAQWQQAEGPRGGRGNELVTEFHAVPATAPVHPERIKRPHSRLQTARVVGPNDGDPYVDDLGRIKVQFPWDRQGKFDEQSSCWMRQLMVSAHQDEGFFSAHKVGAEVLVDFLDGDIDRPIVMGAVYNGMQTQPYGQPSDVAKSSWKVKSIPGGKGYNEFTFDNSAGKENIVLHAQKNLTETVLAAHTESIGASQSSSVGADQSISVGKDRTLTVGKNHTIVVTGNESTTIVGGRLENVIAGENVAITAGRGHFIGSGNDVLSVSAGDRNVTISGAHNVQSHARTEVVATTVDLNAGTAITIHHQADAVFHLEAGVATLSTATAIVLQNPSGTISMADGKIIISAAQELVLTAGGTAKIALEADGTLNVSGPKTVAVASGGSAVTLVPASATLNASAVNVTASGALDLSGAMIKLN